MSKSARDFPLRWAVLAASAAALALRLYRLDFQALWWDEGISLYLAAQNLDALVFNKDFALDLHPPLYHVLLALWTTLVGEDVFTARAFSALLGAANVPLLYLLVRRLAGSGAGLVAAWLLATSPIHIFYSQEVRMYTLVPVLATLSLLAFIALLRAPDARSRGRALAFYVASSAAGLYAYYYIGLLICAQNLFFAVRWLIRRGDTDGRRWVIGQVATFLLFVPWLITAGHTFLTTDLLGMGAQRLELGQLPDFFHTFGLAFTVGFSVVEPWSPRFAILYFVVALVGLGATSWRPWGGRTLSLLWLLLPVVLAFAIATQRAFVFPRFVLFSALAVYAVVGAGVALLWGRVRPVGVVVGVLLLASSALGLSYQYATPRTAYASGDYLVLMDRLAGMVSPGDVLLANQSWLAGYARGYLPEPQPALRWAPPAWSADEEVAAMEIKQLLQTHGRVWLVSWTEGGEWEPSVVEEELARAAESRFVEQYGEFRGRLFVVDGHPGVTPPAVGRGDVFGDSVRLSGFEAATAFAIAAGSTIDLALVWEALAPMGTSYTVFTQLLGPDGRIYAQKDNPPVGGTHPTTEWRPGEVIVDRYLLEVDVAAPEGSFTLIVGLYDLESGHRLPVGGSDHVQLATFVVRHD